MARSHLWRALTARYLASPVEQPGLRSITLAQWAHESDWGTSALALLHYNFGGLNYRRHMQRHAMPVTYESSDGRGSYCHFATIADFISGYWQFLSHPRYTGWHAFADDGASFIEFIAARGYATDRDYVGKVMRSHDEVLRDLSPIEQGPP